MADLISRAVLLKDLSYCAPELWQDEEYIKAKIMKQSTIDAIPVEWLRKISERILSTTGQKLVDALIERWHKKQEAQDG